MGYENITVGGLHIENLEIALVNKAYWNGDGQTSGLMRVAYSALTSAYIGTNLMADNFNNTGNATGDQTPYSPIFQIMISVGLMPPLLRLTLERSKGISKESAGGYIAFGGLPPVAFHPVFASTPIEIVGSPLVSTTHVVSGLLLHQRNLY